jgi:hypothetical protein
LLWNEKQRTHGIYSSPDEECHDDCDPHDNIYVNGVEGGSGIDGGSKQPSSGSNLNLSASTSRSSSTSSICDLVNGLSSIDSTNASVCAVTQQAPTCNGDLQNASLLFAEPCSNSFSSSSSSSSPPPPTTSSSSSSFISFGSTRN